uniref:FA1m n=1 Tax=Volvox carteri f. nagariensis TaxID=3068 RepID=D9CJ90_VOLCA|nr:FA1m [Volvox carteri f. nagariensis]
MPPKAVSLALAGRKLTGPPEGYGKKKQFQVERWISGMPPPGDLDLAEVESSREHLYGSLRDSTDGFFDTAIAPRAHPHSRAPDQGQAASAAMAGSPLSVMPFGSSGSGSKVQHDIKADLRPWTILESSATAATAPPLLSQPPRQVFPQKEPFSAAAAAAAHSAAAAAATGAVDDGFGQRSVSASVIRHVPLDVGLAAVANIAGEGDDGGASASDAGVSAAILLARIEAALPPGATAERLQNVIKTELAAARVCTTDARKEAQELADDVQATRQRALKAEDELGRLRARVVASKQQAQAMEESAAEAAAARSLAAALQREVEVLQRHQQQDKRKMAAMARRERDTVIVALQADTQVAVQATAAAAQAAWQRAELATQRAAVARAPDPATAAVGVTVVASRTGTEMGTLTTSPDVPRGGSGRNMPAKMVVKAGRQHPHQHRQTASTGSVGPAPSMSVARGHPGVAGPASPLHAGAPGASAQDAVDAVRTDSHRTLSRAVAVGRQQLGELMQLQRRTAARAELADARGRALLRCPARLSPAAAQSAGPDTGEFGGRGGSAAARGRGKPSRLASAAAGAWAAGALREAWPSRLTLAPDSPATPAAVATRLGLPDTRLALLPPEALRQLAVTRTGVMPDLAFLNAPISPGSSCGGDRSGGRSGFAGPGGLGGAAGLTGLRHLKLNFGPRGELDGGGGGRTAPLVEMLCSVLRGNSTLTALTLRGCPATAARTITEAALGNPVSRIANITVSSRVPVALLAGRTGPHHSDSHQQSQVIELGAGKAATAARSTEAEEMRFTDEDAEVVAAALRVRAAAAAADNPPPSPLLALSFPRSCNLRLGFCAVSSLAVALAALLPGLRSVNGVVLQAAPHHLTALNLTGCEVGPVGAALLTAWEAGQDANANAESWGGKGRRGGGGVLRSLQAACLADNGLGPEGVEELLLALVAPVGAARKGSAGSGEDGDGSGGGGLQAPHSSPSSPGASCCTVLDLSLNNLADVGCKVLARSLPALGPCLRVLALSHNGIGTQGAGALSGGLVACRGLQELILSGNQLGDQAARELHGAFIKGGLRELQVLHLQDNPRISCDGIAALSQALSALPSLEQLDVSRCYVGDEGARYLAKAVSVHPSLALLALDNCKIRAEGAAHLAAVLGGVPSEGRGAAAAGAPPPTGAPSGASGASVSAGPSPRLSQLILARNLLGDRGAAALAAALGCNTCCLTELDLRGNGVGLAGCRSLEAVLRERNTRLRRLDMTGNEMEEEALKCDTPEHHIGAAEDVFQFYKRNSSKRPYGNINDPLLLPHPVCKGRRWRTSQQQLHPGVPKQPCGHVLREQPLHEPMGQGQVTYSRRLGHYVLQNPKSAFVVFVVGAESPPATGTASGRAFTMLVHGGSGGGMGTTLFRDTAATSTASASGQQHGQRGQYQGTELEQQISALATLVGGKAALSGTGLLELSIARGAAMASVATGCIIGVRGW